MILPEMLLYEDEALLAVNKPAGLRTIQDGYDPTLPHLIGLLQAAYGEVWVVHRLDKDTSGTILFARTSQAHRELNRQFEQRQTVKEYHALVLGSPDWEEREITLPLRLNGDRQHRTVVDPQKGRPASTTCRVLRRFQIVNQAAEVGITLIAAWPHSGYTHQIRAHLSTLGLPLVGDPLYKSLHPEDRGRIPPPLPIQRTALHAAKLSFTHPTTGAVLTIPASYPQDFAAALQALRAKA